MPVFWFLSSRDNRRPDSLTGSIQYMDAQVDDARHTMTVVRTAATFGALAASRVKVTGFLRAGERVTGATMTDLVTGRSFEVRAKQVINAQTLPAVQMPNRDGFIVRFPERTPHP